MTGCSCHRHLVEGGHGCHGLARPASAPPDVVVELAEELAARSQCRSRRGAVLYYEPIGHAVRLKGSGFNGPPGPFACPGRDRCKGICGQLCVHAEMRALRGVSNPGRPLDLVHVELGPDGHVTPSGGPSCWQCSREILDVGFVAGVWLYEKMPEEWCPHIDMRRTDCLYCQGELCHQCDSANPGPRCEHDVLDRHHELPIVSARWRYHTAEGFHRRTLRNTGLEP